MQHETHVARQKCWLNWSFIMMRDIVLMLQKNLIFDGTSGLKLEMTSYSDNAYDVANFFYFEKFLAHTLFLPSFNVVRPQMAELTRGGAFLLTPVHYKGIPDSVQNRIKQACTRYIIKLCRPRQRSLSMSEKGF